MKPITEAERRMREFPCWLCNAAAGEPCVKQPSRTITHAHSSRFWQATEAGRLPLDESNATGGTDA